MRVEIGAGCVGSGECELIASSVFSVGDDMRAQVIADGEALTQFAPSIREAAKACPTAALRVVNGR